MPAQPRPRCAGTPALRRPRRHAACRYTGMLHEPRSQRYRHTGMPEDRLEDADTDVGPLVHEWRTYRPGRASGRRAPPEVGRCQDRGLAGPPRPYNRRPVRRRRDFTIRGRPFCVPAYRITQDPAYRHTDSQPTPAAEPVYRLTVIPAYRHQMANRADRWDPFLSGESAIAGTPAPGMPVSRTSGTPAYRDTQVHDKLLRQPVCRHTGHRLYRCAGIPVFRGAVLVLRAHRDSG